MIEMGKYIHQELSKKQMNRKGVSFQELQCVLDLEEISFPFFFFIFLPVSVYVRILTAQICF